MSGRITKKQIEILTAIQDCNEVALLPTYENIAKKLSYTASRQAVMCSLKFMCEKAMVEKGGLRNSGVKNQKMQTFNLTEYGKQFVKKSAITLEAIEHIEIEDLL